MAEINEIPRPDPVFLDQLDWFEKYPKAGPIPVPGVEENNGNSLVPVCKIPADYDNFQINSEGKFYLTTQHAYSMMLTEEQSGRESTSSLHFHGMGKEMMMEIPGLLCEPRIIAVSEPQHKNNSQLPRIACILDKTRNVTDPETGKTVKETLVAFIEPPKNPRSPVSMLVSAYPLAEIDDFIKTRRNNNEILYELSPEDKKKTLKRDRQGIRNAKPTTVFFMGSFYKNNIAQFVESVNIKRMEKFGMYIKDIPEEQRTNKVCNAAFGQDKNTIIYFPEKLRTVDKYAEIIETKNKGLMSLVPDEAFGPACEKYVKTTKNYKNRPDKLYEDLNKILTDSQRELLKQHITIENGLEKEYSALVEDKDVQKKFIEWYNEFPNRDKNKTHEMVFSSKENFSQFDTNKNAVDTLVNLIREGGVPVHADREEFFRVKKLIEESKGDADCMTLRQAVAGLALGVSLMAMPAQLQAHAKDKKAVTPVEISQAQNMAKMGREYMSEMGMSVVDENSIEQYLDIERRVQGLMAQFPEKSYEEVRSAVTGNLFSQFDKESRKETSHAIRKIKSGGETYYVFFEDENKTTFITEGAVSRLQEIARNQSESPQFQIEDGVTYGYVYKGEMYLNPDLINTNTVCHEYTHLWDEHIRMTNPELCKKGIELYKKTALWKDSENTVWRQVENDEFYRDRWEKKSREPDENGISSYDQAVFSECHARTVGKFGAEILRRIREENGGDIADAVIDWNKEASDYLAKEFGAEFAKDDLMRDFFAKPMQDLFSKKEILRDKDSLSAQFQTEPKNKKQKEKDNMENQNTAEKNNTQYVNRFTVDNVDENFFREIIDGKAFGENGIDMRDNMMYSHFVELAENKDNISAENRTRMAREYVAALEENGVYLYRNDKRGLVHVFDERNGIPEGISTDGKLPDRIETDRAFGKTYLFWNNYQFSDENRKGTYDMMKDAHGDMYRRFYTKQNIENILLNGGNDYELSDADIARIQNGGFKNLSSLESFRKYAEKNGKLELFEKIRAAAFPEEKAEPVIEEQQPELSETAEMEKSDLAQEELESANVEEKSTATIEREFSANADTDALFGELQKMGELLHSENDAVTAAKYPKNKAGENWEIFRDTINEKKELITTLLDEPDSKLGEKIPLTVGEIDGEKKLLMRFSQNYDPLTGNWYGANMAETEPTKQCLRELKAFQKMNRNGEMTHALSGQIVTELHDIYDIKTQELSEKLGLTFGEEEKNVEIEEPGLPQGKGIGIPPQNMMMAFLSAAKYCESVEDYENLYNSFAPKFNVVEVKDNAVIRRGEPCPEQFSSPVYPVSVHRDKDGNVIPPNEVKYSDMTFSEKMAYQRQKIWEKYHPDNYLCISEDPNELQSYKMLNNLVEKDEIPTPEHFRALMQDRLTHGEDFDVKKAIAEETGSIADGYRHAFNSIKEVSVPNLFSSAHLAQIDNFIDTPFLEGLAVPAFTRIDAETGRLEEYSGFHVSNLRDANGNPVKSGNGKTADAATVVLQKATPESTQLVEIDIGEYNRMVSAGKTVREQIMDVSLSGETMRKCKNDYEDALGLNKDKIRENTAENFEHNVSAVCRTSANSPHDAMLAAKSLVDKMDVGEKINFERAYGFPETDTVAATSLEKKISEIYAGARKEQPIADPVMPSGVSFMKLKTEFRWSDEDIEASRLATLTEQGATIAENSAMKIGDAVEWNTTHERPFSGFVETEAKTYRIMSCNGDTNTVVLATEDMTEKIEAPLSEFVRKARAVEQDIGREPQEPIADSHEISEDVQIPEHKSAEIETDGFDIGEEMVLAPDVELASQELGEDDGLAEENPKPDLSEHEMENIPSEPEPYRAESSGEEIQKQEAGSIEKRGADNELADAATEPIFSETAEMENTPSEPEPQEERKIPPEAMQMVNSRGNNTAGMFEQNFEKLCGQCASKREVEILRDSLATLLPKDERIGYANMVENYNKTHDSTWDERLADIWQATVSLDKQKEADPFAVSFDASSISEDSLGVGSAELEIKSGMSIGESGVKIGDIVPVPVRITAGDEKSGSDGPFYVTGFSLDENENKVILKDTKTAVYFEVQKDRLEQAIIAQKKEQERKREAAEIAAKNRETETEMSL